MIIGIAIMVIAALVVLIGTRPEEARVLYYDAVDVTPEMQQGAVSTDTSEEDIGAQSASVLEGSEEAGGQHIKVTVAGAAVNSSKQKPVETLDELRQAAAAHDPNAVKKAQGIYDDILGGRL